MDIRVVVHEAEEGGFWAEVPAIPGCAMQGETMNELMANLREAIEGCLAVEVVPPQPRREERMLELAVCNPSPAAISPGSSSGRTLLRVCGRHHICAKVGRTVRLSIPVHGSRAQA